MDLKFCILVLLISFAFVVEDKRGKHNWGGLAVLWPILVVDLFFDGLSKLTTIIANKLSSK
jgi:hypothetical protein